MTLNIKRVKIFVTIPKENTEEVRDSVCKVGAGIIGEYSYCTTSVDSIGTFLPSENTNPYIGEKEKLEFVKEDKLEFVCDCDNVKKVLEVLRKVHPYEEPAIDIVPLIDEDEFN